MFHRDFGLLQAGGPGAMAQRCLTFEACWIRRWRGRQMPLQEFLWKNARPARAARARCLPAIFGSWSGGVR